MSGASKKPGFAGQLKPEQHGNPNRPHGPVPPGYATVILPEDPDDESTGHVVACKPMRLFFQIDLWDQENASRCDPLDIDHEGDACHPKWTWEPQDSAMPVRVLVHQSTDPQTAARLLRFAAEVVEREAQDLAEMDGEEPA